MRLNENTTLRGDRVLLVPYRFVLHVLTHTDVATDSLQDPSTSLSVLSWLMTRNMADIMTDVPRLDAKYGVARAHG